MKPKHMIPKLYMAFAIALVLTPNAAGGDVYDTDGRSLIYGARYYVLPAYHTDGGGLTVAGRGSELCPLDIVQARSDDDEGIPVKIHGIGNGGVVHEYSDVVIQIDATNCSNPALWVIREFEKQLIVSTGKVPTTFMFRKMRRNFYFQFMFYDNLCLTCKRPWRNVGIFVDKNGVRRLAITDSPFWVKFVRDR